jgi:hypothetical protein
MSALKRKLKNKKPPEGWDMIEEVIEDFEQQMKDAVNDEHEGKRKAEGNWKIHRIHWEKNRFIYDLMYVRKVMSRELVSGRCCCLSCVSPGVDYTAMLMQSSSKGCSVALLAVVAACCSGSQQ